ncbi:hypothetical protein [Sporomusa ovata]|uniref:hypothetical protein n=1 Tax=Sporomusa ovata TaxID=2378 RepID=UPI0030CEA4DE
MIDKIKYYLDENEVKKRNGQSKQQKKIIDTSIKLYWMKVFKLATQPSETQ